MNNSIQIIYSVISVGFVQFLVSGMPRISEQIVCQAINHKTPRAKWSHLSNIVVVVVCCHFISGFTPTGITSYHIIHQNLCVYFFHFNSHTKIKCEQSNCEFKTCINIFLVFFFIPFEPCQMNTHTFYAEQMLWREKFNTIKKKKKHKSKEQNNKYMFVQCILNASIGSSNINIECVGVQNVFGDCH